MRLSPGFAVALCLVATAGHAQNYPTRPVRMVVPFPPGGSTDVVARSTARKLTEFLSQTIVIDNRPGAGGNIGSGIVAQSVPDGYTILMGTISTHVLNPLMYPNMTIDPNRGLELLQIVATSPLVLVTPSSSSVRSVQELISTAKTRPGELNFASASSGTTGHLALELLKLMAGINLTHVPFKGGGPAMTALVAGQVQFLFDSITTSVSQVNAGRVRALAVTSGKRTSLMPEVPTLSESGIPGFEATGWWALMMPRKIAPDVVSKLRSAAASAMGSAEIRERFSTLGAEPFPGTAAEQELFVKKDKERWSRVIQTANLKFDF